jgi:transposase
MPTLVKEQMVAERVWERVKPLLPKPRVSPLGGRPRASDRACFEAIIHVLRNGCRWRDIPDHFPSPATCWRRHMEWSGEGVWERVWQIVVEELDEAKLLDTDELFADATFSPAQKGATKSGKPRSAKG